MTRKLFKYDRRGRLVADDTGVLQEGESFRNPLMISDHAAADPGVSLAILSDRAADPSLDQASRLAALDELNRRYAAVAASNHLAVLRYPSIFPQSVRDAVIDAPCAAGRNEMEGVYAAYDAHIRDSWRQS